MAKRAEVAVADDDEDAAAPPAEPLPAPPSASDWQSMLSVPMDRPVYLTADPAVDPAGVLSYWRSTREKLNGRRGWHTKSFWAAVLSRRPLEFEPQCWRESMAVVRAEVAA